MSSHDDKREPTQKTPQGHEIPIPKRKTVMDALRKVGKGKRSTPDRPEK